MENKDNKILKEAKKLVISIARGFNNDKAGVK